MPYSAQEFQLMLCIPEDEKWPAYKDQEGQSRCDTTELAHFFGIMKRVVTSLNPGSFDNNPFTFKPRRDLVLDISERFNDRIFLFA